MMVKQQSPMVMGSSSQETGPGVSLSEKDALGRPSKKPPTGRFIIQRPSYDVVHHSIRWIVVITLAIIFLVLFAHSNASLDSKNCKVPFMQQAYLDFPQFNQSQSRLGSKYSLHLYHEETDPESEIALPNNSKTYTNRTLSGTPVLFIPGNAGSFRQVRSFAAEGYERAVQSQFAKNSHLDFFSVDFREDLTAFSGELLLDQAEYINDAVSFILDLYRDQNEDIDSSPLSVILMGHSMGGVVARATFMLPNYTPGTVNTILTLAAPHVLPPLTLDAKVVAAYNEIDEFWRNNLYDLEEAKFNYKSHNILSDVAVISLAGGSLDTMIASDHASLAGKVPEENGFTVYTSSIPHVWSGIDHLAVMWCDQLRKVVVDALEQISSVRTMSLAHRLDIFRQKFLHQYPTSGRNPSRTVKPSDVDNLCSSVALVPVNGHMAHVSHSDTLDREVLICTTGANMIYCNDLAKDPDYTTILAPTGQSLIYSNLTLHEGSFLCFLSGENVNVSDAGEIFHDVSPKHRTITIPAKRPALVDLSLHGIWSSLMSYKVHVLTDEPRTNFLLRQHIDASPYEYRFFPGNDSSFYLHAHGIAPFVPFSEPRNVHLQIWTLDTEAAQDIHLRIEPDYLGSLSRIALHYRSTLAVFPVVVLACAIAVQVSIYYKYEDYLSLTTAIQVFADKYFIWLIGVSAGLPHLITLPMFQFVSNIRAEEIHLSSMYLGLPSSHMWALGPCMMLVSTGVCYCSCLIVEALVNLLSRTMKFVLIHTSPKVNRRFAEIWTYGYWVEVVSTVLILALSFYVPHPVMFVGLLFISVVAAASIRAYRSIAWSRLPSNTLVEVSDVPEALTPTASDRNMSLDEAVKEYNTHNAPSVKVLVNIICIMLWALPENILSVVVWIKNYQIGWSMNSRPGSNFFSVLGFSLLLFSSTKAVLPPPTTQSYVLTMILLFYIATYTLLFGLQYSFWIHQLWNMYAFWLALLYIN